MSYTKPMIACAVLLMLVTTSVQAQRRGGMRMFGGNSAEQIKIQLLGMEKVRKEIKLDEDDAKKVADIASDARDEIRQEMRELIQDAGNFREMDEDERKEFREKFTKMMNEINGDAWKEISKIVDKDQIKRLDQLAIQRQGASAFLGKNLQKELEITKEQIKKMREKNTELQKEMQEAIQEAVQDRDREAMNEARTEYREASQEAFMKILTDKQKKKYKELIGEEFEFPQQGGRRGR